MRAIGIVAEYNPFHNGHARLISQARTLKKADAVIVVMSGSFTQRGDPACFDKFTRARHALLGGADMVIELPDLLSVSCAERFAFSAVRLLNATGLVDTLAFGSECGDIDTLKTAAFASFDEAAVQKALSRGESYPRALASCSISGIASPNDILAVEYLRAIDKLKCEISPLCVKRNDEGYHSVDISGSFSSASAIREAFYSGDIENIRSAVPEYVFDDIRMALGDMRLPVDLDQLSKPVLFSIRSQGAAFIKELADVSEGLENPIFRAALRSSCCGELLSSVKTKRYTYSRLKRILAYSLLGTTNALQKNAIDNENALYIRVLGIKKDKLSLLSELSKKATLPVITCYSDCKKLPIQAVTTLEFGKRAHLLRALAAVKELSCGDEFSNPLVVV